MAAEESTKVVFTMSGWGRVESRDQVIPIRQGSIVTVPHGLPSRVLPYQRVRTGILYICPEYITEQLRWLPGTHPLVHLLQLAHDGDNQLHEIYVAPETMRALSPALVQLAALTARGGDVFELLAIISDVFHTVGLLSGAANGRRPSIGSPSVVPRREVLRAVSLLEDDLKRRWRIKELADEVALSSSQLVRLFQRDLGLSPAAYLVYLRAERMAEILTTSSLGVSEAAILVGWRDPSVASRAFKKRYGVSPRDFATRVRRKPKAIGLDRHQAQAPSKD